MIAPVYRRPAARFLIPGLSLHQCPTCLAVSTGRCYAPRPEAFTAPRRSKRPVHSPHESLTKRYKQAIFSRTTPLPYFGIDRIGDFGQAGTASMWKSGPLFSTGTKEAELVLEELRLNPWAPAARSRGRRLGESVGRRGLRVDPSLSTGFAGRPRLRSTAVVMAVHRGRRGTKKEGVG